jgi:hypothetical protein
MSKALDEIHSSLKQTSSKINFHRIIEYPSKASDKKWLDSLIEDLISTRDAIADLCDPQTGSIQEEYPIAIAENIKPIELGPAAEQAKALDTLAIFFKLLDNIWILDILVDKHEPTTFDRTDYQDYKDGDFIKNMKSYQDEVLLKGTQLELKRSTVVDIMHDSYLMINRVLGEISANPIWGDDYTDRNETRRLDKFVGDHAGSFIKQIIQSIVTPIKQPCRVYISFPETFDELKEIIQERMQRFIYLFRAPD